VCWIFWLDDDYQRACVWIFVVDGFYEKEKKAEAVVTLNLGESTVIDVSTYMIRTFHRIRAFMISDLAF
jgi:hypothetical protein